jgi:protein SCO1/2
MENTMDDNRRTIALLAVNGLALAGLAPRLLSLIGEASAETPVVPADSRDEIARRLPNVEFRTQDNRRVRFYDDLIKGKKVLINFMYTECNGICPRSTSNLVKVQEAFGDRMGRDVFFLSISLTPERDTPEKLKAYAREQGAGDGWYFLTGSIDDVDRVRRALGVYDNADISQHTGILMYGNEPEGKWGATSTLASAEQIAWSVTRRIDPWVVEPWPARASNQE